MDLKHINHYKQMASAEFFGTRLSGLYLKSTALLKCFIWCDIIKIDKQEFDEVLKRPARAV